LVFKIDVVGKPIRIDQVENPSQELIDKIHKEYVASVQKLYDDYKDIFHTHRIQDMQFVQ
jgi:hypothetical protein